MGSAELWSSQQSGPKSSIRHAETEHPAHRILHAAAVGAASRFRTFVIKTNIALANMRDVTLATLTHQSDTPVVAV